MTTFSKATEKLISNVYKAVEIAIMKNAPVIIEFAPNTLTIEVAEMISSYLDDLTTVQFNFDARRSRLTIIPLIEKTIFFIDDTQSGRLH